MRYVFVFFLFFLTLPGIGMDKEIIISRDCIGIIAKECSLADMSALCQTCTYAQLNTFFPFIDQDTENSRSHKSGSLEYFLLVNPEWCESLSEKDHVRLLCHCAQKNDACMMEYIMSYESVTNKKNRYEFLDSFTNCSFQYSNVKNNIYIYMTVQKNLCELIQYRPHLIQFKMALLYSGNVNQRISAEPTYDEPLKKTYKTLLNFALECKRDDIAQLLIDAGVCVNPAEDEKFIPLHQALNCRIQTLKMFINHPKIDINVRSKDRFSGQTLLHEAGDRGNTNVVELLLAHPKIDTQITSCSGNTPLRSAQELGQWKVVALLKAHEESRLCNV